KVPEVWVRLADLFAARGIKGSFGVLAGSLADATPEAVKWMQDQRASGRVEFWFHGWDHAAHVENGEVCGEFTDRSYEEQKRRFDDSQKLVRERLGFAFETFGPPGGGSHGSFDASTTRVMAEDPDMKVWLYPQPLDDAGRELQAAGKVTILDRVWSVNLESAVGVPYLKALEAGWAANPQREYFVLQGHPAMWAGAKYDEWLRVLDFLIARKAVFMTPAAYVAELGKRQPAAP
ncbi:MAG: polysaccharide deacetylase family protein, partial [Armatimonadetes bacterium]|nr:polysaccharide deacetylase family protein [Armatimonadota bacterium]